MEVRDLGVQEYKRVWVLQQDLVDRRLADEIPDTLLLVEHPHVVTLGRRGKREDVFDPQLPVFEIERGGEATYHGPGQLVGYPIVKMADRLDVKRFVTRVQTLVIDVAREFGVPAGPGPQTGVWVERRKLGSIGVAVNRNVTYHGLALNVNTDLSYFLKLRPCGYGGEVMTSLAKERGAEVDMNGVKTAVTRRAATLAPELARAPG
jgi:lipoyl(octanoyl) transferase